MTIRLPLILAVSALLTSSACAPLLVSGATTGGVAAAQERTIGTAVDDATIHTKIWNSYLQSDTPNLYSNIAIEVHEGRVMLTGPIDNADSAARAVQLAWSVDGVKEVINEIQIVENAGPENFAKDALITGQVKARLFAEKNVKSVNYTIETVNGVVYIMGLAQNEDELARVLNVASRVKGVQKVVSHARLKTDPRRMEPAAPSQQQTAPLEPQTYQTQEYPAQETSPSYDTPNNYSSDSYTDGSAADTTDSTFTPQY